MKALSVITACAKFKCPRCHKGDLFTTRNPYKLKELAKMPVACPCCGQATTPEPGFYYGAMYSSYAICVVLFLINFFVFGAYLNLSVLTFSLIYTIQVTLLMPLIFRYARVSYLYMFVSYDAALSKKSA